MVENKNNWIRPLKCFYVRVGVFLVEHFSKGLCLESNSTMQPHSSRMNDNEQEEPSYL